ncbi:MAG: AAA family ATPase [Burkholderiaceae bacterium]|nr:AAA family ATPase [Burkholderiaceae bacterium]
MLCVHCEFDNPSGNKFCGECGTPLRGDAAALKSSPANSSLSDERKQVTVMFCDVVGSTELTAKLGEDRMHRLLNEFFGIAIAGIHRYEGSVNKFLGDGFMALFGAPIAHEDHTRRAALAAVAIRDAVANATWESVPAGQRLQIRMGLDTGTVVFGKVGGGQRAEITAIGDTTNVAARLQSEAPPGGIACSEGVATTIDGHFECRKLGLRTLKGKGEPILVYEIALRKKRAAGTAQSTLPLLGRQAEMTQVRSALDALTAGQGGILMIVGEAGMGKSRLLAETRQYAAGQNLAWVEGTSLSFGSTLSYWPFREVIRRCFNITEEDGERQSWQKLSNRMASLFGREAGEEMAPFVGVLLTLNMPEPFGSRMRAIDSISMGLQLARTANLLFERLSREQPLAVCLEDWHWADSSSADLLLSLLQLTPASPILFVIASRPEQAGAMARLERAIADDAGVRTAVRRVQLKPLGGNDVQRIIGGLLGGERLAQDVAELLSARAGGNPFYVGEMVRMLKATHAVVRDDASGEWRAASRIEELPLPNSIEGVILARIDRLEDEVKQVLKVAAVVGHSFFHRVLKVVADEGVTLDVDLAKLVQAQFIDQVERHAEIEYMFKHPLIQQATYNSLLESRRKQLHLRIGETIEQFFVAKIEEFYPILAYHYAQAQEWTKAQEYLMKAADQAGAMSANEEAFALYQRTIEVAEKHSALKFTPYERAVLDVKIGEAMYGAGKLMEATQYFEKSLRHLGVKLPTGRKEIARKTIATLIQCLPNWLATIYRNSPQSGEILSRERTLIRKILINQGWIDYFCNPHRLFLVTAIGYKIGRGDQNCGEFAVSLIGVGYGLFFLGRRRFAERCFRLALRIAKDSGDTSSIANCHVAYANCLVLMGLGTEAVENFISARELFVKAGDLGRATTTTRGLVAFYRELGHPQYRRLNQETNDQAKYAFDPHNASFVKMTNGRIAIWDGDYEGAIRELGSAIDIYAVTGNVSSSVSALCEMARSHIMIGNFDEAEKWTAEIDAIDLSLLRGSLATWAIMGKAQVLLMLAESGREASRNRFLVAAAEACRVATRYAKRIKDYGCVESLRLEANLAWLQGKRGKAEALWHKALIDAEQKGYKPVLADTNLDLGQRLGRRDNLLKAQALWAEIGSPAKVAIIQDLLNP